MSLSPMLIFFVSVAHEDRTIDAMMAAAILRKGWLAFFFITNLFFVLMNDKAAYRYES
jgi:hypothetical protein